MLKKVTIGDLGTIITGNTPSRNRPELYGNHTPFIKATDISENTKYTYKPEECYSEQGHKKYIRSLIPKGATCVVTIGSIGKKMTMAHCDCFINQAMNAIVPSEHFDNEYVYYAVKNVVGNLKSLDSGTASGRENVSKSAFSKMPIIIEQDKNIQMRIGKILSAYDDLIENNQKQIKLLEEAAQRLYKEWFVDLRFPGYEHTPVVDGVPEGWTSASVEDICTLRKETLMPQKIQKGIPYIGLEHMPRRDICLDEWGDSSEVNSNKYAYYENDILFGRIRPYFHKVGFTLNNGVASTDSIIMIAKRGLWGLLLMTVSSKAFVDHSYQNCKEGSKMPRADWNQMKQYKVLIAGDSIQRQFEDQVYAIACRIKALAFQKRKLIEARDCLLPKLMSGDIEV